MTEWNLKLSDENDSLVAKVEELEVAKGELEWDRIALKK
jgi:hypothetical protein